MADTVLRMENVTMQFGGVVAVDNLNIEVRDGEIVSLIGPNGAGKTTAFNVITGVYQPTNGLVEFDGSVIVQGRPTGKMKKQYAGQNGELYAQRRVVNPTPDRITQLGIARTFQNIRLWKSMSVFDNILVAMHMRRDSNVFSATFRANSREEAEQREKVMELLEIVGLADVKDAPATSLPYGRQRRLEIIRAMATQPRLLLLDEPAAGMNPQETLELGSFIVQLKDMYNITVLMIEHHMDLVMKFSERIYAIDFGKLICEGSPDTVASDKRVIEAYLGVSGDE
ncbi:MAG: ABC transporter ATP-binding protein [Oscillospiraceae bacterium]|nr:ABC transporter ATP-binding protein [Oscillospiraceae bacterium]